jgi:GDSL-like Lipase/Acylhydrolase family
MLVIQNAARNPAVNTVSPAVAFTPDASRRDDALFLDDFTEPTSVDGTFSGLRTSQSPLTWVLVGDSFLPTGAGARQWPGLVELFTSGLRSRLRPPFDPIVDACMSECRVRDVLDAFHDRIQQRNPSVVILFCGAADSADGMSSISQFENSLLQIARRLKDEGVLLVLNTSPVPHHTSDDPLAATHMVYAETVRGIAAELDLPLVDHRRDWEQFAIPPCEYGSWYEFDGRLPSAFGHRQIALKLLSVLAEPRLTNHDPFRPLAAMSE